MPNNNTELISRYLQNEMSATEKISFEQQLAADPTLREEMAIQQQIVKAAEAAGLKNEFGKAIRRKIVNRRLLRWGLPAVVLVTAFIVYAVKTNLFSRQQQQQKETPKTEAVQQFVISSATDTIIETRDGVVFAIPAGAFDSQADNIRVEVKTALTPYDIMRQGLSTVSNGSLLQTAGMFYINGYEDDKPLAMKKDIHVSVPANEVNPDMQLFDGVQDSSGNINWVNPKKVDRNLRTYDITTLDFYPPDYIPTLKALGKNYLNKRYTDSLYYSFSGYPGYVNKDTTNAISEGDPAPKVSSQQEPAPNGPFAPHQADRFRDTSIVPTEKVIRWYQDYATDSSISGDIAYHYEIDPARIGAIWNEKYNNTILATKEFEERLRYMHGLCTSFYLDAYLHNLDKPMYEIDRICAGNASGAVKKKFKEFARRKDGAVFINEGMQAALNGYFQAKYKAYQQAAAETWAKHQEELNRLNAIADDNRREQAIRDFKRDSANFWEEYCINLTNAYQQIGIRRSCNDTTPPVPPAREYYNVTISTPGWKNLDMYVFDATTTRQSMSYTDPETGKKATLTYRPVTISVENSEQYDKVFVYLVPDSLSSFQRMEQKGNVFTESLNSLFRYDAIGLAYKGTQAYIYRQASIPPGDHSFTLTAISEEELKSVLRSYKGSQQSNLDTEWEYQLFEQQEEIRQVQVRKDVEFRRQVAMAIFKCFSDAIENIPGSTIPLTPK